MSKHKHIGRKSLSVLLAVLMMLTSMYAGLGVVAEALYIDNATTLGSTTGGGAALTKGGVYKVTGNVTIAGNTSKNGRTVPANSKVVIYIASGATLTINGGAANGTTAGKAGIYLPNTSTIIFTGPGTLKVNGGKGGNGTNGKNGSGSNGGAGGSGGAGGGAGIGGNGGGVNTAGGAGGNYWIASTVNQTLTPGDNGSNGNNGSNASTGMTGGGGGGGGRGGKGGGGAAIGAGGKGGGNGGSGGGGGWWWASGSTGSPGAEGSRGAASSENTTVKNELTAVQTVHDNEDWDATLAELVELTVAQLETRKTNAVGANNATYNIITGSSYSTAIIEHFSTSGFIASYKTYVANLDKAIPIKTVKENVDLLNTYVQADYSGYNAAQKTELRKAIMAAYLNTSTGKYDIAAMNSDLTKVSGAISAIRGVDNYANILNDMQDMGGAYATFKLESCDVFKAALAEAVDVCGLIHAKMAVDADIATYGDAVADPLAGQDVIADAVLEALQQRTNANNTIISNAATKYYFTEVFPDGMQYVTDFKAAIDLMVNTRAAEKRYDENYYQYFTNDRIFAAYGLWDNNKIETRYDEDSAKLTALINQYNADKAQLGETIANAIYTINFEGADMLLQDAVQIYLDRLRANMIERNDAQLAKIAEFAKDADGNFTTTITINNFMGVKGALGQYDNDLYTYVKNKSWPINDPFGVANKRDELNSNYEAYLLNPKDINQVHNHDANGVFTTRYAGLQTVDGKQVGFENDIARDGTPDDYVVTETKVLQVIDKLEAFLKSNELSYLATDFDEPLDEMLMRMVADMLFTDKIVNLLVGALYPTLCSTFEGIWRDLPRSYDTGIFLINTVDISYNTDLRGLISQLGLAVYPDQVASKMGSTFASAKSTMASKSTWAGLQDAEGNLTLNWGLDDIKSDDYDSMSAFYNAKANRFKAAVSDGLKALEPVLKALFAEAGFSKKLEKIANVKKGIITLTVDLTLSIGALPGYSILVAPIFEAFGITPKTRDEAKGLTTTASIVNAILDPLSSFITGTLAQRPVNTLLDILPNLMFGLSFDKLSDLLNKVQTRVNYVGDLNIIGSAGVDGILNDGMDIKLGDYLNVNELIEGADGNKIALTDVNGLLNYLVGMAMPDKNLQLPVINGGKIIMSAAKQTNAPTRRVNGSRINFVADKADEFYVVLDWLIRALGDETFVNQLLYALGGSEPNEIITSLVKGIAGNTDAALAALVELIVPQTYDFMDYEWVESTYNYNIDGLKASEMPYLYYGNDWTREKAQNIVAKADDTLSAVLGIAGLGDTSLDELLTTTIGGLYTNQTITGLVKALASIGTALPEGKLAGILDRELGLDLTAWANTFGYLFDENLQPPSAEDNKFPTVTASGAGDNIVWSVNGTALEDGADNAKDVFVDLFCAIGEPFAPVVALILTGRNYNALGGLVTVKGYDTYEYSFEPLFKALGIETMSGDEYATFINEQNAAGKQGAVEAFNKLAKDILQWVKNLTSDKVLENVLKILPNVVYFLESNGLAAALHNALLPILVLLDTARPILDININTVLSELLTSLVNKKEGEETTIDFLGLLFGTGSGSTAADPQYQLELDVNDLRLSTLFGVIDKMLGTDFANSPLVKYAIPAMCMERKDYTLDSGFKGYTVNMKPEDALSVLLAGLIEGLRYTPEGGTRNSDVLGAFLTEKTGSNAIPEFYNKLVALFSGDGAKFEPINWDYMLNPEDDLQADTNFALPPQTTEILTYLSYDNDWTRELAEYVSDHLDDIVKSLLTLAGQDENAITTILTNLVNDNFYSDEVINAIIELLVGLISGLDEKLVNLLGDLLDIDITAWYNYCDIEKDEETGKVISVKSTKQWNVTDRDSFVAAFTEAAQPLDRLILWLFNGKDYALGHTTDRKLVMNDLGEMEATGDFTYDDLLTLKGGEGYKYGLVPILEALGAKPAKESGISFVDSEGNLTAMNAVASFLDTLCNLVDSITTADKPVENIVDLLPNLIYFINADGLKASVNNLTAPLETLVATIMGKQEGGLLGSIGEGEEAVALNNLTTDNILKLVEMLSGLSFTQTEREIIETFYLGKVNYDADSASGLPRFYLTYSEDVIDEETGKVVTPAQTRKDMITIIVSLLLDVLKNGNGNAAKLDELLDTNGLIAKAVEAIGGVVFEYEVINWNYYVDGEDNNADDPNNVSGITEGDFTETTGLTYLDTYKLNDWTKDTAKYVDANLEAVVNSILEKFGKEKLDELLAGINLYNDDTINAIMSFLSGALKGLDNIDDTILNLIAKVLGVDFTAILEYEDDVKYDVTDKDSFLNALFGKLDGADLRPGILTPFERLFKFMLFGKSYEYLTSAERKDENDEWADQITVTGGQGYDEALVPVLEALGVEAPAKSGYTSATALLKDAADAILTRIDSILHSDNMIVDVLNMLPELCYFLNADGLKICANNLVKPVLSLVEKVNELEIENVNIDLSALTDMIDKLDVAGIAGIVEDNAGIAIPPKVIEFIETNRIGTIQSFTSANGETAYKADYTDKDHSDLITCILSAALETVKYQDNADKLAELLGTDAIGKVLDVLTAGNDVSYSVFDWDYNKNLAKSTTYIGYPNNWTEETAKYVDANLGEFADMLAQAMKDENGNAYASFNAMINDKIALYNDETVNTIAAALKNVAQKIDDALVNAVGADTAKLIYNIIGVDLTGTLAYVENTTYGVTDKASFVAAVKTLIAPFNRVLSFLLLDEGYKFFVYAGDAGKKDDDIIVVNGAEGYKKGLIPLMEAIGCDVKAADYESADALMNDVLTSICDRVDELLAKPLDEILDLLPNLIYFINADGLTVSVNNTIAAISTLYTDVLAAIGKEGNLDELLGFTLSDLSFDTIFALVKDKTDIDLAAPIGAYLTTFNFGDTVDFASKNGETTYKMTYNSEDERHDMLTIVASLLLEVLDERSNETAFRKLIGDDAYQVVYNLLNMTEVEAEMQKIHWTHTDKADTGEVIEPLDTTKSFNPYGPLFTREKAQYLADHFQEFIDNMIQLLGIEGKDGKFINSLEDLLKDVVGNSLYTTANLEKIYGYIDGALKKVNDLKGSKHIKQVLKESEIADLTAYDGYKVASISDGDRAAFTAEIIRMVQPLYPVLKWLLTDEDLAFFTDKKDADQVVLLGAEGYKYGIVPVLEALLCTKVNNKTASFSSTIMDQAAYKAAVEANDDALLTAILNPVFDKLDQVMADPANELFNLIPNVQYFINSNALDTCFKNILNAVYTLTNALEPLTGKIDIMDVLGIKLNELTMSSIVNALVSNIGTDDIKLDGMDFDKLLKCFNGYLYSYTNTKSGQSPAYYMAYAGEAAKADTLAVILQMLLQWIASGDNPAKLKQIIREKIKMSDEGYAYADKLIDIAATYAKTPSGTDSLLHVIYYIFYGLYNGTAPVANWQKDYNTRLELLQKDFDQCSSRDKNLGKVAELLDFLFVEYAGGDKDDTGSVYHNYPGSEYGNNDKPGFASNGFISFFQQIINWIRMLVNKIFHR